jgi:hypothetical protein
MNSRSKAHNSDWIGCIDFGTSFSKLAVVRAVPKDELEAGDIKVLAIGDREGFPVANAQLLASSVYIHDQKIVFGEEAERDGIRNADREHYTFTSLKQYLSTHELSELDAPLPKNIDPTGRYTARIALKLFWRTSYIRRKPYRRPQRCRGRFPCVSRAPPGIEAARRSARRR